ncbi:hypothetical protein OX459_08555 [Janthinobacterium sp. SUN026]|uniref:hypothetical protein n=1 Tax=Janthinobacterium sp. SUN026 TaxID=3002438 RepID=UPI0025B18CFC|nr:hypothetical protein [Janthinobacterium sp. SUN026]MDN2671438.1 hypothetical protein [Janthinobacterium sp. SUN026]
MSAESFGGFATLVKLYGFKAALGMVGAAMLAEIQHMPAYADEFWKLYAGEKLLAEWRTPEATQ